MNDLESGHIEKTSSRVSAGLYWKHAYAKYIIDQAEKKGVLKPGTTIVDATGGNTGIALAMIASREKALPVGTSSGANVLASIQILNEIGKEKKVVAVLPDRTERYFSTDLHAPSDRKVRQCSRNCECLFE